MKIKLSKTQKTLDLVNGTALRFTATQEDLVQVAKQVESELMARGVYKKNLPGTCVTYIPAGAKYKSYKYSAKTTTVKMIRSKTGWFMTSATSSTAYPGQPETIGISITNHTRMFAVDCL